MVHPSRHSPITIVAALTSQFDAPLCLTEDRGLLVSLGLLGC
jgi:hypothetical protein